MVVFNRCMISEDGKHLIVEAEVDSLSYYRDQYISTVIIDTDETFTDGYPSSNKVYVHPEDNYGKSISIVLSAKDLKLDTLNDNIFFIYVKVSAPSQDTPCCLDREYNIGVAVNYKPIYNIAMHYIKELGKSCTIPKGFIDAILRIRAFELSLKTGHFDTAISQWHKLFKDKIKVFKSNNCGCNGYD